MGHLNEADILGERCVAKVRSCRSKEGLDVSVELEGVSVERSFVEATYIGQICGGFLSLIRHAVEPDCENSETCFRSHQEEISLRNYTITFW